MGPQYARQDLNLQPLAPEASASIQLSYGHSSPPIATLEVGFVKGLRAALPRNPCTLRFASFGERQVGEIERERSLAHHDTS